MMMMNRGTHPSLPSKTLWSCQRVRTTSRLKNGTCTAKSQSLGARGGSSSSKKVGQTLTKNEFKKQNRTALAGTKLAENFDAAPETPESIAESPSNGSGDVPELSEQLDSKEPFIRDRTNRTSPAGIPLVQRIKIGPDRAETLAESLSKSPSYYTRSTGYLPYEYVKFTDNQMIHQVTIEIDAGGEEVFAAWQVKENYGEWFDVIGKTIIHLEKSSQTSFFFYYQWGNLPAIELYTTLGRTHEEFGSCIAESSTDGMPLGVGIYLDNLGPKTTKLMLRVAYLLPENLQHYVGPVGVWADINQMLTEGLNRMKKQIENPKLAKRKGKKV